MNNIQIILLGKPGCHLCDDARNVISQVLETFAEDVPLSFTEQSILDDQTLYDRYWEEIPVVLINGKVHDFWRVDADRFRSALTQLLDQ